MVANYLQITCQIAAGSLNNLQHTLTLRIAITSYLLNGLESICTTILICYYQRTCKMIHIHKVAGLLFDDFVGFSQLHEVLRKVIDIVHTYCNNWGLRAKSAVMMFSEECGW